MTSSRRSSDRQALVDTSGHFALIDRSQSGYAELGLILRRLAIGRWLLFTTNFVVAETHALVLNRLGRPEAMRFLRSLDHGAISIIRITERDETRARLIIDRYEDKEFSMTDALSFAAMERLQTSHVLTLDRDFTQYGFIQLTPDNV